MFKAIFSVLYKIIDLLNLQVTVLIILLGVVLYLTGVFNKNPIVLTIFYILLVISVVVGIVATIKKLLGIDKRIKRSKGAQIVKSEKQQSQQRVEHDEVKIEEEKQEIKREQAPTYYKVKQNPNYVMAEYKDRYVLYKKTEDGLRQIRVDYK